MSSSIDTKEKEENQPKHTASHWHWSFLFGLPPNQTAKQKKLRYLAKKTPALSLLCPAGPSRHKEYHKWVVRHSGEAHKWHRSMHHEHSTTVLISFQRQKIIWHISGQGLSSKLEHLCPNAPAESDRQCRVPSINFEINLSYPKSIAQHAYGYTVWVDFCPITWGDREQGNRQATSSTTWGLWLMPNRRLGNISKLLEDVTCSQVQHGGRRAICQCLRQKAEYHPVDITQVVCMWCLDAGALCHPAWAQKSELHCCTSSV